MNGLSFIEALEKKARMYAGNARKVYESNREVCDWLFNPLARWAHKAYGDQVFEYAAKGYVEYCVNISKAQRNYELEGKYASDKLDEIVESVYKNESYMTPYMWAAILIYGFWESMISHLVLFREEFLNNLPEGARLIEFACGHGVLGLISVEHRADITLAGYDISPSAIAIASKLSIHSGHEKSVSFEVQDILNRNIQEDHEKYDGVISAMLAEHLKDPEPLFNSINYVLKPGGKVYFSTALESAQPDHIYEFNRESAPILMAEKHGFRVSRLVSDAGARRPGDKYLPRALAMILEKN